MKRFQFPLRPLAKLRAHFELSAREAFAAAVQVQASAEAELSRAKARVLQLEKVVIAGRQRSFSGAGEALNLRAYRGELGAEAVAQKGAETAKIQMEQRRAEYIEAHRRLEVVKRLEQKAHASHRLELNREEQAEFDDLAGRRAAQKAPSLS
jgi:flagellar export protein FliJ